MKKQQIICFNTLARDANGGKPLWFSTQCTDNSKNTYIEGTRGCQGIMMKYMRGLGEGVGLAV